MPHERILQVAPNRLASHLSFFLSRPSAESDLRGRERQRAGRRRIETHMKTAPPTVELLVPRPRAFAAPWTCRRETLLKTAMRYRTNRSPQGLQMRASTLRASGRSTTPSAVSRCAEARPVRLGRARCGDGARATGKVPEAETEYKSVDERRGEAPSPPKPDVG